MLSHILGVSLPPSACSNPLCRHPPPSSEGGEGAPAPCMDYFSALPSVGRYLPLFFCNQKKSRKTVKEKFRPLPSRSRVRLPPKGGINAPPKTVWFLISTASPTGSRAVFQYPSGARPPEVLRTNRGYYFDSSAKGAHSARRLSRDWQGEGAPAPRAEFALCGGRERRFALNMPQSAEKARSFAEKFFILRGFGRRRLDYYGEQGYN